MNTLAHILSSWLRRRPVSLALALVLLAGCAQVQPEPDQPKEPPPDDPYARSDLDGLLEFGADLGGKTAAERAEVCRALLSQQKEAPGVGVQLHLLSGRLLSDTCGDIPKILDGVESIPADSLPDERVRRLVSAQKEVLRRMSSLSKKLAVLERKQKSLRSLLDSKGSKAPGKPKGAKSVKGAKVPTKDGDASLLRKKLEAIRDMEQKLDESGGGN